MIVVQNPGAFTTVQDLGRPMQGMSGVSRAGAADPVSLRLGNRLLGNPENASALEMTLLGGTFVFPEGAVVAIAGPESVRPVHLQPGETLRAGPIQPGVRGYLCVRGGIEVPLIAGSASTHVPGNMGGFEGRPLRKLDTLRIGTAAVGAVREGIRPEILAKLAPRRTLRVTLGPQADWFPADALAQFLTGTYTVSNNSNRLGVRLDGPALSLQNGAEMTTEGVPLGAIQITAGGLPIILFVDQQTTGGYPKIANVVTVDLPSVGQLRPGDQVRFEQIDPAHAHQLIREREALLKSEEIFL